MGTVAFLDMPNSDVLQKESATNSLSYLALFNELEYLRREL